jgi:hypothetical protein
MLEVIVEFNKLKLSNIIIENISHVYINFGNCPIFYNLDYSLTYIINEFTTIIYVLNNHVYKITYNLHPFYFNNYLIHIPYLLNNSYENNCIDITYDTYLNISI